MSADRYPSIFILRDIPIFFLQVSLQAIALDKKKRNKRSSCIEFTTRHLGSSEFGFS